MLRRALTWFVRLFICLALALTGSAVGIATAGSASAVPSGTEVSGTLAADTTWTAAGSPYIFVGTVDIPAGLTLTVEAGVELRRSSYSPDKLLRVAGALRIQGTDDEPVIASDTYSCCATPQLVSPATGQTSAVVEIEGLHTVSPFAIGDGTASFAQLSITDSTLEGVRINLDNSQGEIQIARNTFLRGQTSYYSDSAVMLANPRLDHVTLSANRFRDAGFGCRGAGRLNASGNTLERSVNFPGARISSADDCLLNAAGNYWEQADSQIGSRVLGSARVIVTPTASAPTPSTPALMPAPATDYQSTNPQGYTTLEVGIGSDGGLPSTLVVTATNRETGEVTEIQSRAQPSWRTTTYETFTFTQLTPGALYRLSSYARNAAGNSVIRETESFIAPTPTAPAPGEDGTAVRGTLSEDTTWTAAGGPYVFDNTLTVPEGVTLTIEAGVVIRRADGTYFRPMFDVGGEVMITGSLDEPVRLVHNERYELISLFAGTSPDARIDVTGLVSDGPVVVFGAPPDISSPGAPFAEFSLKDSVIPGSLTIDNSIGTVTVLGNSFPYDEYFGRSGLTISNPRSDHVTVRDNRFRSSTLSCTGAGRLTVSGNTFERSSNLSSNDDCIVNASGNFWESTDDNAAQRINGRARVTFLPTLDAPTEATPSLAPGQHYQGDYVDESGRANLSVSPGSDGGLESTIVATATNRESGEVEQTLNAPVGSWQTDNTERFVFDSLTPGSLYRLSSYVENTLGRSPLQESQSFLAPQRAPSAPQGVSATGSGTSATITWTAPGTDNGNAITGYTVTSQSGDQVTAGASARTATITGLGYSTAYTFTVTATSAAGTSPASAPSNTVTTGAAPPTGGGGGGGGGGTPPPTNPPTTPPVEETKAPEAPTAVSSIPGDGSAMVSWTAGDDNGEAITGFTVTRFPGGVTTSAPAAASSITVNDLANGTAYTFTVSATNATGTSGASAPSAPVTPAGRPGQPGDMATERGDRSATVTWSAVESNGSPLTGYTVTASPGGSSTIVGPQQTSAVVDGLTNGIAYTFTVTATNGVGNGTPSTLSSAVTPAGAPGRVAQPLARIQRLGLVLTWTAPASNGADITAYVVTMNTGRTFTLAADARKLVLQRVRADTKLRFTVLAVNAVGSGRTSEWSNIVMRKKG